MISLLLPLTPNENSKSALSSNCEVPCQKPYHKPFQQMSGLSLLGLPFDGNYMEQKFKKDKIL